MNHLLHVQNENQDQPALDFARTSGNLNLGIVVLSANNEVVFQASLVTSQSLSTRLTLPSAGQYTIGVFRIDLLPLPRPKPPNSKSPAH